MNSEKIYKEANKDYTILQKEQEFIPFMELINEHSFAGNCLELGICNAGTSKIFTRMFNRVISIDKGPKLAAWDKLYAEAPNWLPVERDTNDDYCVRLLQLIELQFDLIFIDAGHSYEQVTLDFMNYKQFLKPGGIIAFHDILESDHLKKMGCYVYGFWEKQKKHYYHKEIIYTGNANTNKFNADVHPSQWGGIGILYGVI